MKNRLVSYLAGGVFLLLFWAVVAQVVDLPIIPSPFRVGQNLQEIFVSDIAIHSVYSLWRIFAGLFLALLVGFPLGVLMGYFPKVNRLLSPLVYLTYPIPKIALLPILMLLCGVGETAKVLMIFLIIVFQVILAVRDGIRSIPREVYYSLFSLGASFREIFFHVLWPASLPKFITAVRVAMATAISVLFFTETFGTRYGMGYFIMDAWLRVNYLEMYSGIVVLSMIGLVLFAIIDGIESWACRWQYK